MIIIHQHTDIVHQILVITHHSMNPSFRIPQNYITPLRSISRVTEASGDGEGPLFTVRIPPTSGARKFSNICLEDVNNETFL